MKNSRRTKQQVLSKQVGGLKKGLGKSLGHHVNDALKVAYGLKLQGKSDQEIIQILQSKMKEKQDG